MAITLDGTTGITSPAETVAGAVTAASVAATGAVSGTTGTFTSAVSGTTGTFTSAVSGTTGTFTGAVNSTNTFGFKNRIFNGGMEIWQRSTSFTSGGSSTYTADRFFGNGSSGTISRSTDVPAGFTYSFSNVASSTAYPGVAQRIESVNIADCASQAITVSFYVKQTSGTASALNINLSYPTAVDNYSSSTTIVETNVVASMTSSWTRYSYTYTLPANVTNGLSVTLFVPSASITATFLITGVQLEKSSTATSFDYRPYGTELSLCQRYYQNYGPRTNEIFSVIPTRGDFFAVNFPFIVAMRVAPTTTLYAAVSGTAGKIRNLESSGESADVTASVYVTSTNIIHIVATTIINGHYGYNFTASAEL